MPKAKKPSTTQTTVVSPPPPAPKAEPVAVTNGSPAPVPTSAHVPTIVDLPIIYPKLEIKEYSTTSELGPLTIEDIKGVLGWITEKEFQQREVEKAREAGNLNAKPEHFLFGDVFHCKNIAGEKVRCVNNAHNRNFDENWCDDLVHTLLSGQWAGPHAFPGETVNGETIRISRRGLTVSGQHCLTAAVKADEKLHKDRVDLGYDAAAVKYPVWAKHNHVFLETIVITGMSEDPRILLTVDYVKPRTAADVFFTSDVFQHSTPIERKDLCKMLATAVDTLWDRTDTRGYKTHPEIVGFTERHRKLLEFVLHLAAENSVAGRRRISKLRLNAGQCAALCYLIACSGPKTDGDTYRNESPPSEKNLDWSYLDRAMDFWTYLGSSPDFAPVRKALNLLVESSTDSEENLGLGGRVNEKLAILAKAWDVFKDHPVSAGSPFRMSDLAVDGPLCLTYSTIDDKGNQLPEGQIKLIDVADFGGIDCPKVAKASRAAKAGPPDPPAPTQSEIERAKEEARQRREAQAK